jgi:hypothetical protein
VRGYFTDEELRGPFATVGRLESAFSKCPLIEAPCGNSSRLTSGMGT